MLSGGIGASPSPVLWYPFASLSRVQIMSDDDLRKALADHKAQLEALAGESLAVQTVVVAALGVWPL
jgi:hypothetical protein